MNISSGNKLAVLSLVTTGLISFCAFVAWQAYREIRRITLASPEELQNTRKQFDELGTRVPNSIRRLNNNFQMYVSTENRLYMDRFEEERLDFQSWMDERTKTWPSGRVFWFTPGSVPQEIGAKPTLLKIASEFSAYCGAATNLTVSNRVEQIERATLAGLHILELATEARGQAQTFSLWQDFSRKWSLTYWTLITVSLAGILVLAVWLVTLLYRMFFVPLQLKLVESNAIIEQQKKLAHFGELAAGLAHEIRNPLTAMNARLYTLRRTIPPHSPEADDANVIAVEISRLERIVKDFLKLARPAPPQLTTVTAPALFSDLTQLLASDLTQRGIALVVADTATTPFQGDAQLLKQVLINLIHNAAEALGAKGIIKLSARFALQRLHGRQREVVVLEVEDNGPGIPADVQARLFDPFFSTKENGTGLGLSISARIVDQHGGAIEFQTQLGRGTTFGIILPVGESNDAR